MKSGVVVFPGSNCEIDMYRALKLVSEDEPILIWHKDTELPNVDLIALPGGFSYGDYLRSGALASFSPIIEEVVKFAKKGGYVLGVCNGFQILTETGLLPGGLLRNKHLKFICRTVELDVKNRETHFTSSYWLDSRIEIPIAHHDGSYYADEDTLKELEDNRQIAFTYSNNPNGSANNIAGIFNKEKNVLGMMPHPERAAQEWHHKKDGLALFKSIARIA